MKRTEIERRLREFKRDQKVLSSHDRSGNREEKSVADYIDGLYGMLYFNESEVMNISDNLEIFELFEEMKEDHPEKQWYNVIKKAVRKTGVKKRSEAVDELKLLLEL